MRRTKKTFTLSEVLITLVVIGIIAAITIPMVLISMQNQEYKTGYKKAYSDLSRAALKGIAFGEFPLREKKFDSNTASEEWSGIKEQLNIAKLCENSNAFDCWVDNDRFCIGCGSSGSSLGAPAKTSKIFIDSSGRAWALYNNTENIFMVDINGDKGPNHFGKDRWAFTFADENGKRICSEGVSAEDAVCSNPSLPYKVAGYPSSDYTSYNKSWCQYPPCYYKSWLYE